MTYATTGLHKNFRTLLLLAMPLLLVGWVAAAHAGADGPRSAAPFKLALAPVATLIMVDDPACHYCRRWNKEVGGGYARTAEGRAAPLRRVSRNSEVLGAFAPVVYTPTFILVRDGHELGRITGYPGQFYFWEELANMMSSAGIETKG